MDARAPGFGYPAPWGYFATVAWTLLAFVVSCDCGLRQFI